MVDLTEFTSHHDFQVIITKIQNFVFGNKWLYVSTYWSHQNYENYENSSFFPIYHLSFLYFCFPEEDQNQNFSIKIVDVFLHIGSFHKFVKLILHSLFVYNMGISN